jgi:hypothetical protein
MSAKPLARSSSQAATPSRATTAPSPRLAMAATRQHDSPGHKAFARTSSGLALYSSSFAAPDRSVPLAAAAHRLDGPDNYSHAYHADEAPKNDVVFPPLTARSTPPSSEASASPGPASFPRYAAARAPTPAYDHLAPQDSFNASERKSQSQSASRLNSAPMRARGPPKKPAQKPLRTQRSGSSISKSKANALMAYSSAGGRSGSPHRQSTSQLRADATENRSSRPELQIDDRDGVTPSPDALALLSPDSP